MMLSMAAAAEGLGVQRGKVPQRWWHCVPFGARIHSLRW